MTLKMLSSYYQKIFLKALQKIDQGHLKVTVPGYETFEFGSTTFLPTVDLLIKDWKIVKNIFQDGEMGFFKSYQKGLIETSNLVNLLSFSVLNEAALSEFLYAKGWRKTLYDLFHCLKRNTSKGSKKNIQAHYDLSNDFFSLWLDEDMNYSSAWFKNENISDLKEAQQDKQTRILDELNLPINSHILEMGCGWGGFAEHAVKQGYQITGVTISKEQQRYAQNRLQVHSNVSIQFCDYRNIAGYYDGIVSIEMFEAVGESYWVDYFKILKQSLKPNGTAVVQTITIADDNFKTYRLTPDFIQLYIFPGGMLPSSAIFKQYAEDQGLKIVREFSFGQDYSKTLRIWLDRFDENIEEIKNLGFDDKFIRLWRYYLCYCIAGFETKRTDVIQFTLQHQ